MDDNNVILVLITVPDKETADLIASALVEKRLAACVNIVPGLTSVYRWEGKVNKDAELLLIVKTVQDSFESLKKTVKELHPHDLPEIIAVKISDGSKEYLEWITKEMETNTDKSA